MKTLLKHHIENATVDEDDPGLSIAVRRRHLWRDSKLAHPNNTYSRGTRVTFVSEAAVDEGGPRREYFRLVLAELCGNNAIFDGCLERWVLRHNLIELQGKPYLIAGCIIALSLMYGGPAPHFFTTAVAQYLLGISPYTVSLEDIPDYSVQQTWYFLCEVVFMDSSSPAKVLNQIPNPQAQHNQSQKHMRCLLHFPYPAVMWSKNRRGDEVAYGW